MSLPLILAALWVIIACVTAMFPSKRNHWPAAYVLMVVALPLLIYIAARHGPWATLVCAIAAASILRWPLIYAWRRVRRPRD